MLRIVAIVLLASSLVYSLAYADEPTAYRNKSPNAGGSAPVNSESAESLKSKLTGNKPELPTRLKLAELLMDQKAYPEVIVYLKPYSDQLPRHGLMMLAKAYGVQKDHLNQIRILSFMVTQSESDYVGETLLGEAHSGNKNTVEAVKHYRAAIQINPRFKPAYEGLVEEFRIKKNKGEARQILEQMAEEFPDDASVKSDLCSAFVQETFVEKAIATCTQAIEKDPSKPDNHVNLSIAYRLNKNEEQAQKIVYQAAKKFPKSALAQCSAGDAAVLASNLVGAMKYYTLAVQLDPSKPECQLGLGNSAFESEHYEEALAGYLAACKINRSHTMALRKAAALLRQRKKDDWERKYRDAVGRCIEM